MGKNNSKEVTPATVTATDASTRMVEASSGFHIIELHLPSMGGGMFMVILVIVAVAVYVWYRRTRRRRRMEQIRAMLAIRQQQPWVTSVMADDRFEEIPDRATPASGTAVPRPVPPVRRFRGLANGVDVEAGEFDMPAMARH